MHGGVFGVYLGRSGLIRAATLAAPLMTGFLTSLNNTTIQSSTRLQKIHSHQDRKDLREIFFAFFEKL
jgi:hypothetical protein